ncbi:MAG TPA: peptidylprolyl isomerase [Vicinamibacterales bacterium]|jgi:peptidyl-prolyl cis-trans isomerase D
MTMLDRMRRHRGWLKWSLAIVVVSFVLLYIPSFLGDSTQGAAGNSVVASVDGREITATQFRRVYQQQMQQYRQSYGANVDERLLKQLGIDQRIVQQMIQEEASLAEAGRLGIAASDAEVRERILSLPAFQENGQFIGDTRYRQLLGMQNPPMRPSDFEDEVRRSIVAEKLQAAVTGWIAVGDKDVETEFRKRNEKVKLAVVNFPADKFRDGLSVGDDEIAKFFEDHKEQYRVGDKRKIRYVTIDQEALRAKATVTGQQIERAYNENIQQYSTPEQVRASHILIKSNGTAEEDTAAKKKAEDLLAQVKKGADFAELARKNSQDESSAVKGGDLDFFPRGQMVAEFDKVAFELQPGQVSDLVKSQFGYHIIKVTDKRAATTKTLSDVRTQIEDQLKYEQAQSAAQKLADEVAGEIKKPADIEKVARARSLHNGETGFFLPDEPIAGIGVSPAVSQAAFSMKEGEVSEPIRTPQGYVFITVTGKQDAYVPKLEEVKAKVRDDVLKQKAIDKARATAATVDASLKAGDFDKAAKAAGLEVKTTDLIARGAPIADIGVSPKLDQVAFALPAGSVSDPIVTENGAAVVKVVERKDPTPQEMAKDQDAVRNELLNDRKQKFFAAYMTKARQRMTIRTNPATIAQIVG